MDSVACRASRPMAVLLLLCFCSGVTASEDESINGRSWLRQYGYTAPLGSTDSSNQDLSAAIREMQRVYNLEVTGLLDQQTITAMKRPRCGVPDKTNVGWSTYEAVGTKWEKYDLTFSIETFAPKLAWQDTSMAIQKAIKVWKDVSPFTFEEIPYVEIFSGRRDGADIMISFHAGPHKGHAFESSDLAHASSPKPGRRGYVHFNSDWQWSVTNQHEQGFYNVFLVAVHQLGHSLGLGHSDDTSSIMHKDYKWMDTDDFQLPAVDHQEIQDLYGYAANCDALTKENAQLKKHNRNLMQENTRLTEEIGNLMRQPTPPPVKSCSGGWATFGGRCYYRNTEAKTWQGARDYCQSQGADLLVINSPEEQLFVRGLGAGDYYSWMGLTRSGGRWTWLDGTPMWTTEYWWNNGFPRNDEGTDCAYYYHPDPGTWYNYACSWTAPTICEK